MPSEAERLLPESRTEKDAGVDDVKVGDNDAAKGVAARVTMRLGNRCVVMVLQLMNENLIPKRR